MLPKSELQKNTAGEIWNRLLNLIYVVFVEVTLLMPNFVGELTSGAYFLGTLTECIFARFMPAISQVQEIQERAGINHRTSGHSAAAVACGRLREPFPLCAGFAPPGFRDTAPPPHAVLVALLLPLHRARFSSTIRSDVP